MSRSTSRWRSFKLPSFSLCSISTYPFRIDNGVLRSCAAEARALVVLRYRSCSCENSGDSSTAELAEGEGFSPVGAGVLRGGGESLGFGRKGCEGGRGNPFGAVHR